LQPGIYTIKAFTGMATWEENIELRPGANETKPVPRLGFPTPVPLYSTAQSHEYHMYPAQAHSTQTKVKKGEGSSIFIFARDYLVSQDPSSQSLKALHPSEGMTLLDRDGKLLVDFFKDSDTNLSTKRPDEDPWSACNVQVDPGFYRLCLKVSTGQKLEQTLIATKGWQTQVFLLQCDYRTPHRSRRLADLGASSIMLSKNGFQPIQDDYILRLVELGRQGLNNQRQVLPKEVSEFLWRKFDNPMLGLYGAHLLLLQQKPDLQLLATVVKNLRDLLGNHPDIEALALKLETNKFNYRFEFPPMFRRSWSLVLEATARYPDLVPVNSLAGEVAGNTWSGDPWLIWQEPAKASGKRKGSLDKRSQELLTTLENHLKSSGSSDPIKAAQTPILSAEPEPVSKQILESSGNDSDQTSPGGALISDETYRGLVRAFGLPRGNLEKLIGEINNDTQ
jgi:hypothetical protein